MRTAVNGYSLRRGSLSSPQVASETLAYLRMGSAQRTVDQLQPHFPDGWIGRPHEPQVAIFGNERDGRVGILRRTQSMRFAFGLGLAAGVGAEGLDSPPNMRSNASDDATLHWGGVNPLLTKSTSLYL